jgi:hypothetical protein
MDLHFKHHRLASISSTVDLDFFVVSKVLQQAEKLPPPIAQISVAPTSDVLESIDWKRRIQLFHQPLVHPGNSLVSLAALCRINEHVAFNAIVVWILTG